MLPILFHWLSLLNPLLFIFSPVCCVPTVITERKMPLSTPGCSCTATNGGSRRGGENAALRVTVTGLETNFSLLSLEGKKTHP